MASLLGNANANVKMLNNEGITAPILAQINDEVKIAPLLERAMRKK